MVVATQIAATRSILLTLFVLLLTGVACKGGDSSALIMVENWEIISEGAPFSVRPGARYPQEVFNLRAQESVKWTRARTTLVPESLKAIEAKASLEQVEYRNFARLELSVVKAFGSELSIEEVLRLAKADADRPQSYFDRRVHEAYEWMEQQQKLSIEERLKAQEAALAKPAAELKAEVRRRYHEQVR